LFHDLDIGSHVGSQDFRILILFHDFNFFHDLANTIKTLPISAGLNSHASNGLDQHMSRTLENTRQTNAKNTLWALSVRLPTWYIGASNKMTIYLGASKREILTPTIWTEPTCIGKQFSFSKALKGTRLQN
jgi:hypothetical protein